ncbi:MAG: hypothetical protein QOH81_3413 [Sphingomonadales bacterium]|jgi:hypothetical protein|nr:hypothetical protein [Sphingomonadales bacterium]
MRQALFALAALAATAAVIVLPFVVIRLLGRFQNGWFFAVIGIVVLAAIVHLARRGRG